MMRKTILICTVIATIIALPVLLAVKVVRDNTDLPEPNIDEIVAEAVAENKVVGIVVGIVDASGTKVYSAGTMEKDGRAVNNDTIFEIASITKVFTSLLLQDMVDRGEVEIDDPVEKFLPASVKVPSKNGKKITLRHLATHHSGLPRLPDDFDPADKDDPYADFTTEKLLKFLSNHKLSREPGEKYEYSNLGVKLLGLALSRKAGLDYETLIVQRICEPLGMDNTRIRLSPGQQTNFATGHNSSGKPVKHWTSVEPLGGSGALRSSMNDMLKFAAANLAMTNSTLSHSMQKTHIRQEKGGLLTPDIALGWHLQMECRQKKSKWFIWHNGGTYGFHSYIGLDKERGRAVVVLANSATSVDDIGSRVIKHKLFDEVSPQSYPIAEIDPNLYDDLVGAYPFNEKISLNVTRGENRLFAQITGQSPLEMFPRSETEFFHTNVNAQYTFEKNKTGSINAVIFHQNGLDRRLFKVGE